MQSLVYPLQFSLQNLGYIDTLQQREVRIVANDIFDNSSMHLLLSVIVGMLWDYLQSFINFFLIATDRSVANRKSGVGIYIPSLCYGRLSVRWPNCLPLSWYWEKYHEIFRRSVYTLTQTCLQFLITFVPLCRHILQNLTWVPSHIGIPEIEAANSLARDSSACPVNETVPPLHFAPIAQFRRYLMLI